MASSADERAEAQSLVLLQQLSTTSLSFLTTQARQQLLDGLLSKEQLGAQANLATSLGGALEFLLAPWLGSLSDRLGRRPFMLGGPLLALPARLLAALKPSPMGLLLERLVSDFGRAFSGTTMCYAALADLHGADQAGLAAGIASCSSVQGLGILLAPLLASALEKKAGARGVFAAAAALTALQLGVSGPCLRETRQPGGKASSSSPLGFLRLFCSGARVRALSLLLALQIAVDGKLLQDQVSLLQMQTGNWTLAQRSFWLSAFGGAFMAGGQLTRPLLKLLGGLEPFTTLAHAASAAAFACYCRGWFWLGLLPNAIGQQRRTATISWLLSEAEEALGAGRAEVLSMTANLRALVEAVFPICYALALRTSTRKGKPLRLFLLPVLLTAFAELAHRAAPRRAAAKERA